jgi:hypothetical protein
MNFQKLDYKASQTRKRFDLKVKVTPFLSDDWTFSLRIVSPEPLQDKEVNAIISETIDTKKKWKKSNTGKSTKAPVSFPGVSAYILHDDSTET